MRAILTTLPGEVDEVEIVDLPDPRPAAGQIRIRMVGAAINPADLHIIDGRGRDFVAGDPTRRLGTGLDVAGIVDVTGQVVFEA